MRILIFTENYYIGGTDSVMINLMNNWPASDEFFVVCNWDHPGLEVIRQRVRAPCTIFSHHALTREQLEKRAGKSRVARLGIRAVFVVGQYMLLLYHFFYFLHFFSKINPDKVLIIGGGYPSGSTARAVALQGLFLRRARKPLFAYLNDPAYIRKAYMIPECIIDMLVERAVSHLVTLSQTTQKNLSRRPALANSLKKSVIYNSIEIPPEVKRETHPFRKELGIDADAPLLLLLANYESRKGHEFLFKAFRQVLAHYPKARLVCAGFSYMADRNRVEALVAQYKLASAVHLLGFRNDAAVMLNEATILVLSSQCCEGLPTVVVEAMARCVPVVATDVGGTREALVDGKGGFILPVDVKLFAEKIIELLGDAELRARVGALGRQAAVERFDVRNMAQEYYELLQHEK